MLTSPLAGAATRAGVPSFFCTSRSTVGRAPGLILALADAVARSPIFSIASCNCRATWAGVLEARTTMRSARPSTTSRISPPAAGSPRSQPTPIIEAVGGSTTAMSASFGGPKLTPHCPHNAFARATWSRIIAIAVSSRLPSGGAPRGVTRISLTRITARYLRSGPSRVDRGPPIRIC